MPGGSTVAAAIQATTDAAARARDENWWAMVAARVTSLETDVQKLFTFGDPEFVAAAHRITRAAQETSDNEKQDRLAAALAFSGSWSEMPSDHRERMERLVADLSSREVVLLKILSDPRGWIGALGQVKYNTRLSVSVQQFLDEEVSRGDSAQQAAMRSAVKSLTQRGLVDVPAGMLSGSGVLDGRATGLGRELLHYLERIGA